MNKKYILIALSLLLASQTLAQTDSLKETKKEFRDKNKDLRREFREEKKEIKQDFKNEEKEISKEKTELEKKEALNSIKNKKIEKLEENHQKFKEKIQIRREKMKNIIKENKEKLKEQIKDIKDERKKKIVENTDNKLNAMNEKAISHFSEVLNRLEKILTKLTSRTDRAESNGQDVAAVRTLIKEAQDSINSSRKTAEAQAEKTYPIEINGEENLKENLSAARKSLHGDLVNTRQTVKSAHESVRVALTALAKIPGVDELKETATSTEAAANIAQ